MKKASLVFVSLILALMLTMGYFLLPAYGTVVEVLGGNGGMDSGAQTDSWILVNETGTGAWTVDTAVYHAGTGSGRLDSPVGANVPVNSYVYYSFETDKVPESATLDLVYKKQFSGTEPDPGNWSVAVELWEAGGSAPLQVIDIDTENANVDFTAVRDQDLTAITKIDTRYELRLVQKGQTGNDPDAKLTTWFDEVKLNVTYDSTPPRVVAASAPTDRSVEIVFSEEVDEESAETAANYSIIPALDITDAELQPDGKTVRLTTDVQERGTNYTVAADSIRDISGNAMTAADTASFTGVDSTPPRTVSAAPVNQTTVDVIFSEPVDAVSAQDTANYAITPALTVRRAVLQTDGYTVRLTTTSQTEGTGYTVTVTGVTDRSGNLIDADNNTAAFTGISPPVTEPPRVISAFAPTNTAVIIKFSAPMDPDSTQNPANYRIFPELPITEAVLQKDEATVRLITATQLRGSVYSVTVANVQDRNGNEIGAAYNTANFTGSAITAATPHGRYLSDTNQCALCHVTHKAPGAKLIKEPTQNQLCYLCHDAAGQSRYDVASEFGKESSFSTSHHGVPEGTQQCTDCHNPHDGGRFAQDNGIYRPRLLQSKADPSIHGGNEFCLSCHQIAQGDTAALDPALYSAAGIGHNNTSFVINGTTPFNPASGTGISCMGCHKSHGSELERLLKSDPNADLETIGANDNDQCYECHLSPSADKRYLGRFAFESPVYNPHVLTDSVKTNVSYPGVAGEKAGQCVNCHDPHGTAYGTSQVSMKTLRGIYNDGKTSYTAADFGFCFGCHNNTSPDAKYDIQTKYNAPNGGHRIKTAGGNLEAGSKLPCESCHSLHGSANNNKYLLKDSLGSNLGDGRNECLACHQKGKTVEGLALQDIPQEIPAHSDNRTPCLSCHGSPHELK